jgi:hypothetical protein
MRQRWCALGLAALALAGCDDSSAPTSADSSTPPASFRAVVTTTNFSFPLEQTVFVPCANGGAGESVTLSGSLHEVFHVTVNDAGHSTVKFFDQPQGVSGVGSVTGTKYQGTGVTQDIRTTRVGFEETFVNVFQMVGQGPGNNFAVHEKLHVTVNANGTVTTSRDPIETTCR